VLLLALLACAAPAQAAVDWPVPRGESREPVVYRYDAAQWKQVPPEFLDDAPACILYAGINYLIDADGTIETITHEVTRLNSRKAIQDLGEYRSIIFDPAYEKVTLNAARVIKQNGQIVEVEPSHVQLRDSGTDFQVYDHTKMLVISYPSLEVGDVIEVKWTTRGKNPEWQGQFFTRYNFGSDTYPIVKDEIRVRLPKDRVLKHRITGGEIQPDIREDGNERTYRWQAVNRQRLPQDDHLPSKEDLRLQVSCSTFASWEEMYKWKQHVRKDCWICTPQLKQIIEEVTRDLKTPLEKSRALAYWVRRNIRYVSVGEKHEYTPHSPAVVLRNRYGDCKDTSQLLAVMLREAGIAVSLASLGVRGDGQVLEAVPSPWATHAILLVTIDGTDHWIDTTSSLSGWDVLSRDCRDRLCYVADETGMRLLRTPKINAAENRTEQTTRITIGPDGSTRCERTGLYHGLAALSRRYDWDDVPAGERRRQLNADLQDANSKSRLCLLDIDEARLKDYDKPVSARMVFEVLDQFSEDADASGNREGSITDSKVWSNLLYVNLDYERSSALELDMPFESIHRYTIVLPPYFALDNKPTNRTVKSKWGEFRVKVTAPDDDPRRLEVEYHTRIDKVRVDPADFEAFHKFHEEVLKSFRVWVTLRPVKSADDAPLLEALLRLTPGDSAAAVLLGNMYLHNQQLEDARRVLQQARRYHPADAKLGELAVRAADGLKEEEEIYRDLIRYFPDKLQYRVALGENLVDQSRYTDAQNVLRPVVQKGTAAEKGQAFYQQARGSFQENKPAIALKYFEQAESVHRDSVNSVEALHFKAGILERLIRPKDAADVYRAVLDIDPDEPQALEALIKVEIDEKNRPRALDYLRRFSVSASSAGSATRLTRAADYHLQLGRLDDALDLAGRAREMEDLAEADRVLGLVYLQQGKYPKALSHLDRADPDAQVMEGLIRSRLALGLLQEALADVKQAEKTEKPSAELTQACATTRQLAARSKSILEGATVPADKQDAWTDAADRLVCAEHAWASGRPAAEVEMLLTAALANQVELGPAYGLRGLVAVEKGKLAKAVTDAERAVTLSPAEAIGFYVRGRVRLERGEAGALEDLRKAAELSRRKDAHVLHWLAAALFKDGNKAEALKTQREAVQLRPMDAELIQQLEEFEKAAS
jgi:tetratricopeptide (TPR) repeat protein